jgi:hypothetical protein
MNKNHFTKKALISFFFLTALHFSFISFTYKPVEKVTPILTNASNPVVKEENNKEAVSAAQLAYDNIGLNTAGLSWDAFHYAIKGRDILVKKGKIARDQVLTIVDFTKPSKEKRLYVIDLETEKLLFHTYVAHGRQSGVHFAEQFSNIPESFQSSLGFYETLGTYNGKHGYSLKLAGLEAGINDKAEARAIVIHSAAYVSEGFIKAQGYLGRSFGCPALPAALNKPIIDQIKGGSCLFIYSKDKNYFKRSPIINS